MWHQVAFPAAGHHRPSTSTKLYCLVTEAHACEQLAEDCYLKVEWPTVKSFASQVQCPKHYTTRPHNDNTSWILIVKNHRTFHKSGMRGAHCTIGSGVLLKMEVGIRKGAWQRAWRYPAYLWPWGEYTLSKKTGGWYTPYTRVYPPIHHWPSAKTKTSRYDQYWMLVCHPLTTW